jgi:hypothetical protein
MNEILNNDSFWAGVMTSKGSDGRHDLKVKSRHVPLLAAMQQRYGGYFYSENGRGVLRFQGELRQVVRGRLFPNQEQMDPIAWTRGVISASAKYDPTTELMTLPWIKNKGTSLLARVNYALVRTFPGLVMTENTKHVPTIPKPFAARVHAWLPAFPETAHPDNSLAQRVLLGEVNTRRYHAGVPQRMARLTPLQKDAILHEAPRLTYKQIGTRQNASLHQIKRVTKKEGMRKKPENVPDETKTKIANMALQGLPPRYIRNTLRVVHNGNAVYPCSTANVRRIAKEEWS